MVAGVVLVTDMGRQIGLGVEGSREDRHHAMFDIQKNYTELHLHRSFTDSLTSGYDRTLEYKEVEGCPLEDQGFMVVTN